MYVDGAVSNDHVGAPDLVKNFFPGKYAAGFGSQQPQDLEFLSGQFDGLFAFENQHFIFVDNQIMYMDWLLVVVGMAVSAAQQCLNTANQHPWFDRFGDIVVAADVE